MTIWQVIDTDSSAMPSMKTVIEEFETLKEAVALSVTDDCYRVRTKPEVRSRKQELEDETAVS